MKTIYVAGPYTKGDVAVNVRDAITMGDHLRLLGLVPFIPHLTHFWHLVQPHNIEYWYEYDMEWLEKCDALFRLSGESTGADKEVARARELGIPVFYDIPTLMQWRNDN
jgi:hypothetical protein